MTDTMNTMKLKLNILVIVSAFFLAACGSSHDKNKPGILVADEVPVSLIDLNKGLGDSQIDATGMFTTDDETLLSFKNGGIIERIYVKEGELVKKGQLLAILNMTELNAKATQVKLAIDKAQRDFNRAQKLYKDSVATLEQFENAKTQLDYLKEDLNTINFNMRYSEIRATTNGYVLLRLANEGQIVGPGTPILQINGASKGDWFVKIGVSDQQWAAIQEGDSARISTDAFDAVLPAKVHRKAEGIDPKTGTFSIYIKPEIETKLALASGMFARVKIYGRVTDSWLIPYSALLDGDAGRGYVFVTEDKVTAKKVEVKIGAIQKDYVEISSGLENYNYVIEAGSPYLKDGSKIKVVAK